MSNDIFRNRFDAIALVMISGAFWAASFPPLPTGFIAFFYLVPLWNALRDVERGWRAFRLGYIWGFIASLGILWWVYIPTLPGMIMLVLFLPLYAALYVWLHYLIARKHATLAIILSPVLLVAVEYFRSFGQFGFPWVNISYSQSYYPILIQFADIVGAFGVSFWIAAINVCMFFIIEKPFSKRFWVALGVFLILLGGALSYGIYKMDINIDGVPVRIAMLQGNVDPYKKWSRQAKRKNAKLYSDMINSVASDVDFIIMPETATACYYRLKPSMFNPIVDAAVQNGKPILTGSLDFDDDNRKLYYNIALLILPDGTYNQQYAKIQLVPFSEQVPLQDYFPSLHKLNFGGSHFSRGKEYTVFQLDSLRFSVFICYESIFGWLGRRFRNDGAQFIMNITNDGWFGKTSGPHQHAMFNVLRAIENRCWIARCANTGISMFIDSRGRITRQTNLFEKTVLVGQIIATDECTIFNTIGDAVGWVAAITVPFILILTVGRKKWE